MRLSRFPISTLLDSASGHLEAHLYVWSLIQSWLKDNLYQPNRKGQAKPTTIYLASVSAHLPSPAAHPPQSPALKIESAQQQLLNLVQSDGDTTP